VGNSKLGEWWLLAILSVHLCPEHATLEYSDEFPCAFPLATFRYGSYCSAMNICVACGGTGGHIFPGLATAQELRSRGHDVTLWLAGRDVEAASIDGWDGKTVSIPAARFPAGVSLRSIIAVLRILGVIFVSWCKIRQLQPDVVLAMGSYTSVGPVIASRLCHVPVVLHEANAIPGKAISFLARFSTRIGITFPSASEHLDKTKTSLTGFPLRKTLARINHVPSNHFTLLIMGGSQGAHVINETLPEAIEILFKQGTSLQIIHLAGMRDADAVEKRYRSVGIPAEVHAFAQDMASIYAQADFAIARAGAASCTELAICGVPSLLVPLPTSAKNHQMLNAMAMAKQGGMAVQPQQDMTVEWLVSYIRNIVENKDVITDMRAKLENNAIANGAEQLADLVEGAI